MTTPLFKLPEIAEGVSNQTTIHNQALRLMEAISKRALSKDTATPPAGAEGDAYIIPAGATGAWAGKANQIAAFVGGGWLYVEPFEGLPLWVVDASADYVFQSAAWVVKGVDASDFLTQEQADAAYDVLGAAGAAVSAHEAASDPHAQYQKESEKGVANGYASLGSDGKVPSTQLPAATGVSLSSVNVFTKNQSVAAVSLGSGVSPAIDASLTNNFKITLGANNTLVNPTNLTEGMILNFAITQDATGSRTLSYGSIYKFPGGTAPTLSTAANAKDFMSCYYDGAVLLCQMNKGFA